MSVLAERHIPQASDGEAILNALPNAVLLVAPDGRIVDANMAAEAFFEISIQMLRRQLLKELIPFGSPLLSLVEQVRSTGTAVNEYKVDLGTPRIGGDRLVDLHVAPLAERARPYRRDASGAHHRRQDGSAAHPSQRRALGDRAGRNAGA
jgi:two-component system nitrogen regulation sensor histidine kinase GlnL